MSAVHLPDADELWQDVPLSQRRKDPGYWVYRQAVLDGAPWHWTDTLALLNAAHDEMLKVTGKAFAVLTGERYFSLGNPGCRGRVNSAGFDFERDGKANVRLVPLACAQFPNPGHAGVEARS